MDLIFYIIGFFVSYILVRLLRKRLNMPHDWETVSGTLLGALCSWVGVFICLFIFMVMGVTWLGKQNFKIRPPRWL